MTDNTPGVLRSLISNIGSEVQNLIQSTTASLEQLRQTGRLGVDVTVNIPTNVIIAISILVTFLAGIFLSLLGLLLNGRYLSPLIIVILAIIIGVITFFLLKLIK